ncbi:MAG: DUF177 domain-containing protein [Desulfobacterales bacterium]|nr:DUF177 domain-containing protein [Desulfobacterales bacterium]
MKNLILHTEQIKDKEIFREFEARPQVLPIIAELVKNGTCEFRETLKIRIRAFRIRELYEVEGRFKTQIRIGCSRCLKNFDAPLASDFALTYTREVPGLMDVLDQKEVELKLEEVGLMYFHGEEIHLQQGIQEQVVMAIPLQPLCAEDCKGLCPRCGSDLNQKDCGCAPETRSNKFAVLKNLKLDTK